MTGSSRRRFLGGALATATVALVGPACSSSSGGGASSTTTTAGPSSSTGLPAGLDGTAVPDRAAITGWIEAIVDQGIRRPGYAADTWTEDWAMEQFRQAGLEHVRKEPVEVVRWEPLHAELVATPAGGEPRTLACFPVPFTAPTTGIALDLAAFDPASPDVAGRAALVDARVLRLPPDALASAGSAPDDLTGRVYDPGGTFAGAEQVLPHTAERRRVIDGAIDAGAEAVIGTLLDYPGGGHEYYVPYDGEARPVPAVWISGADGTWLHEQLAAGPVRVELAVDSTAEPAPSWNIVGELPGADDDLVVIGSHHDGPWASAVEDASGTALVVAQARFWAAQPADRRPHRMVFVLQAGHMCGSAGLRAFLIEHADELERMVLEVHLEHAALDVEERDGTLVATDQCTPRWFFTSRIAPLEDAVCEAIAAEDLARSLVLAPDAIGENPPTDGGRFHQAGVPVVQFLAAPPYLFDPADTIDKLDTAHLVPLTRATIRIIDATRGRSAAQFRAG